MALHRLPGSFRTCFLWK